MIARIITRATDDPTLLPIITGSWEDDDGKSTDWPPIDKPVMPILSSFPSNIVCLSCKVASKGDRDDVESRKNANSTITLPDLTDNITICLSGIESVDARLDIPIRDYTFQFEKRRFDSILDISIRDYTFQFETKHFNAILYISIRNWTCQFNTTRFNSKLNNPIGN